VLVWCQRSSEVSLLLVIVTLASEVNEHCILVHGMLSNGTAYFYG
jgi:hypothetical protein